MSKNFLHMRRGIRDGEAVAGLARVAIERDERGEAGGVDAGDVREIERDVLPAHQRLQALEELLFVAAHQFSDFVGIEKFEWS